MPYIGAVQYNPIGDLLAKEVKNFNLNYPLKSMGIHLEPPKPLECSVCGKTECEHLQTIFNKVRVADSDEGGVIDALFEEEEDGG